MKTIISAVTAIGISNDGVTDGISFWASTNNPEGVHLWILSKEEMKCIPNAVTSVKKPAGIGLLIKTPHVIRQDNKNKT